MNSYRQPMKLGVCSRMRHVRSCSISKLGRGERPSLVLVLTLLAPAGDARNMACGMNSDPGRIDLASALESSSHLRNQ